MEVAFDIEDKGKRARGAHDLNLFHIIGEEAGRRH